MEKKNVYGYVRVSTDTQSEYGFGIETQEKAIIKYCKENNFILKNIFYDKGISGVFKSLNDEENISNRPGLQELLQSINGINTIIVSSTSRLWRNDMAKIVIIRELKKLNGSIIALDNLRYNIDATDPSDKFFNTIMEALDEYERLTINLRLAKGRTTKAKKGDKPAGRQAFGYEFTSDGKKTIINESQALIVKEIFSMRSQGTILKDIVLFLNKNKTSWKHKNAYTGKYAGRIWQIETVRKMLKNPFYIGKIIHGGETFDGNHEAIIDMNVWNSIHPDGLTNN